MAVKKRYWAVCYAHVCRWAGPCLTGSDACHEAFGVRPDHWHAQFLTAWPFPNNPKYMPLYKRKEFLEKLFARHLEKTGNEVK